MGQSPSPAYFWVARPEFVPPEIEALSPDSEITLSNGRGGTWVGLAGDLVSEIKEVIGRQTAGFYTLQEASHILAESVPGINAMAWQDKLNEAWRGGVLVVRDRTRTKKSLMAGKIDYTDLVKDADLDAWLKNDGAGYLFPRGEPITSPASAHITATPAPVATVSDSPAPLQSFIHSTKTRRDTLTPVIELAQSQCRNSKDTAEVWAALLVLAEKKTAPLIGATEDGLQYLKGGTAEFFNRDALRKRLDR